MQEVDNKVPKRYLNASVYDLEIEETHNYYANAINVHNCNEALGRLQLSPFEPVKDFNEALEILRECGKIAQRSFELGGNSFAGGYVRFDGTLGTFANECLFYQNPKVPKTIFRGRPVYSYFLPSIC